MDNTGSTISRNQIYIFVASIVATLILQSMARWFNGAEFLPDQATDGMTLLSVMVIGGCTVYLVSVVGSRTSVRITMWLAVLSLVAADSIRIAESTPYFGNLWLFEPGNPWLSVLYRFLDLGGLAFWIIGFYLLVFEVSRGRAALAVRSRELQEEIRERKSAQTILAQRESELSAIFNQANMAILILDTRGNVVKCNKASCLLLGYEEEELLQQSAETLSVPSEFGRSMEVTRLLRDLEEGLHEFETRCVRKNNVTVSVRARMTLARASKEEEPFVIAMIEDLTDRERDETARKRMEDQMLRSQKLESLGSLAGGFAHDFNNLLAGIMGNADLLLLDLADEPEKSRFLESILSSSRRAAELCQNLLAYAGRHAFKMEAIDFSELVTQAVDITRDTLPADIVLNLAEDLPECYGDLVKLRQLVFNLLSNSAEAMEGIEGHLRVTTSVVACDHAFLEGLYLESDLNAGDFICLEIMDSGCGIAAEDLSRIFDPFYSTKQLGSGLGLAAVLGIVKSHRGNLSIESIPGKGTTIRIYFPAAGAPKLQPAQNLIGIHAPGEDAITVLVIDDEPQVRKLVEQILIREGFEVLAEEDGMRGIDSFKRRQHDIRAVILDLSMPGLNGIAVAQQLRAIRPDMPIILSSGYDEEELRSRYSTDCISGILKKPYRRGQLIAALNTVLNIGHAD